MLLLSSGLAFQPGAKQRDPYRRRASGYGPALGEGEVLDVDEGGWQQKGGRISIYI